MTVNGRTVNIPSYRVRPGDVVAFRDKAKSITAVIGALELFGRHPIPDWLTTDVEARTIRVNDVPVRGQIDVPVQEQLIVELYSK